jgi:uncharacterized protein YjbJ (UPF0337 family)
LGNLVLFSLHNLIIEQKMSEERVEGKERKEHGKAEEKIGKEFDDPQRQMAGKEENKFGKTEEKLGKEKEKKGLS